MTQQPAAVPAKETRIHKGGRPSKFPELDLVKLEDIARRGYTTAQIAACLHIGPATFNRYRKYPVVRNILRRARAVADCAVEQALYRRAVGYTESRDVIVYGDTARVLTVEKRQPPSVAAARLWLSNRQPLKWSKKVDEVPPFRDEPDEGFSVDLSALTREEQDIVHNARRVLEAYQDKNELIFIPDSKSGKNGPQQSARKRYAGQGS